jgi:hypothetical protein
MKRAIAALIAIALIQTLTACGTLAGAAIGGGIGSTHGRSAQGTAIAPLEPAWACSTISRAEIFVAAIALPPSMVLRGSQTMDASPR